MNLSIDQTAALLPIVNEFREAQSRFNEAQSRFNAANLRLTDAATFLLAGAGISRELWTGSVDLRDGLMVLPLVEYDDEPLEGGGD